MPPFALPFCTPYRPPTGPLQAIVKSMRGSRIPLEAALWYPYRKGLMGKVQKDASGLRDTGIKGTGTGLG